MIALSDLPHRRVEAWKWSDLRAALAPQIDADETLAWPVLDIAAEGGASAGADYTPRTVIGELARKAAPADGSDVVRFVAPEGQERTFSVDVPALARAGVRRVQLIVHEGARATVLERWAPDAAGDAAAGLSWDIGVAQGGRLERVVLAASYGGIVLSDAHIRVMADAAFHQTMLSFGARLSRLETHVAISGEGAEVVLNGASLLAGEAHADHTTLVSHLAPGAVTRETFRSVVTDAATGVFQGKIKVDRIAQETDARMNHGALLLSENAGVNAKPELEIYADNVQCAHGNTAGALDADALHYMRARGLPEARAKALLVEAFVGEVLDEVAHEETRERLRAEARAWMEAHL